MDFSGPSQNVLYIQSLIYSDCGLFAADQIEDEVIHSDAEAEMITTSDESSDTVAQCCCYVSVPITCKLIKRIPVL